MIWICLGGLRATFWAFGHPHIPLSSKEHESLFWVIYCCKLTLAWATQCSLWARKHVSSSKGRELQQLEKYVPIWWCAWGMITGWKPCINSQIFKIPKRVQKGPNYWCNQPERIAHPESPFQFIPLCLFRGVRGGGSLFVVQHDSFSIHITCVNSP